MRQSASASAPLGEGFAAFYEENARTLLVFFARRTYDAEAALDLTAETFAEALASRHRFKDQGEGSARKVALRNCAERAPPVPSKGAD